MAEELCPRCNGDGEVPCRCAGDMCLCDYYGEAPCPLCYGEGRVSKDRANGYLETVREMRDALAEALREGP